MADLVVDNHLDFKDLYEIKRALIYKNAGLLPTFVQGRLYMDTLTNKAYIQDGSTSIDITKQGTVTSVATSQPSIITISTATTIPTVSIAYASALQDGLMSASQASILADASETHTAGKLAKWNSGAGANLNGTATNVTASLDQIPAPAANVDMNNKQFTSLAVGTIAGQATEYSQFNTHATNAAIHTPLDNASHANDRVISAQEVDSRIVLATQNLNNALKPAVQDITELKTLNTTLSADYPDKVIILVEDFGTYRLDRQSALTEDLPRVVTPTTGTGRWIRISTQLTDHNNMNSMQGGTTNEFYHLTSAQNQAAAGTSGAPSNTNRFVTDADSRLTNSRAPSGAAGGQLGGSYPNPTVEDINFTLGTAKGGTGATTPAAARKTLGIEEVKTLAITGTPATQYNFPHNLNNLDAVGSIKETTTPGIEEDLFFVKITNTTVNNTRFEFGSDCTGRTFKAIVKGLDLNP